MKQIKDLQLKQAKIRDIQRERLDVIHNELHQIQRDFFRESIGGHAKNDLQSQIDGLHAIIHDFMKGFDEAVLIHERIAEIKGEDSSKLTQALLEVKSK